MRALRDQRPVWLTAPVLTVAVLSIASGLAQFSVTTVIGDVAAHFGEQTDDEDLASQLGLPATTIGLSLAIIRLSSIAALPAAAYADRVGRRRLLVSATALGLGLTALAAASPSYWVYVALVAVARPALTTLNTLAGVVAAEEATSRDRSSAIALIAVAYGLGAGVVSVTRGLLPGEPSFRVVTAVALLPLLLLPLLARRIREPRIAAETAPSTARLGAVPRHLLGRVALLWILTASIAVATGPGFTYLFVYGEGVLGASPLTLSVMVLGAGPAGLLGVLIGRWGADAVGRRVTAGVGMALTGTAVAVGYSGEVAILAVGYLTAIAASTAFAPAEGALVAELVPTRVRATVAGWMTVAGILGAVAGLAAFGLLADVTGSFAEAARWLGTGVAVTSVLFVLLPETRGMELDEEVPPWRRGAPRR